MLPRILLFVFMPAGVGDNMLAIVSAGRCLTLIVFVITIDLDDTPQCKVDFFFTGHAVMMLIRQGDLAILVRTLIGFRQI